MTKQEKALYKRPLQSIDYHRNGVGGLGFHVMIVKDEGREMLVVRFDKESDKDAGGILCAAFDLAKLDERNIAFFENSFRGNYFSSMADKIIAATDYEKDYESSKKRLPGKQKGKK